MKTTHFDRIIIIQSLSEGELHTGAKLYEDIYILNIAHDIGVDLKLYNVKTKEEFINLLSILTNDTKMFNLIPMLHIEAHGNSKGLELSSGDFISWKDLKNSFIKLNIATGNNLFIALATCYGAYLAEILGVTDRAPCWGLVGPKKEISAGIVFESFIAFYKELLTTSSGDNAVKLLNAKVPHGVNGYYFTSAERFFEQVFNKYSALSCTNDAIKERAHKIRKECKKLGSVIIPSMGAIKRDLVNVEKSFKKYKRIFFMIDLYPENEKRFTIKYRDLKNLGHEQK